MLWLIGVSRSVVAIISRIQTKFKITLYVLLDVDIRSHFHANVKAKLKTIKISGYVTQLPEWMHPGGAIKMTAACPFDSRLTYFSAAQNRQRQKRERKKSIMQKFVAPPSLHFLLALLSRLEAKIGGLQ